MLSSSDFLRGVVATSHIFSVVILYSLLLNTLIVFFYFKQYFCRNMLTINDELLITIYITLINVKIWNKYYSLQNKRLFRVSVTLVVM